MTVVTYCPRHSQHILYRPPAATCVTNRTLRLLSLLLFTANPTNYSSVMLVAAMGIILVRKPLQRVNFRCGAGVDDDLPGPVGFAVWFAPFIFVCQYFIGNGVIPFYPFLWEALFAYLLSLLVWPILKCGQGKGCYVARPGPEPESETETETDTEIIIENTAEKEAAFKAECAAKFKAESLAKAKAIDAKLKRNEPLDESDLSALLTEEHVGPSDTVSSTW
jgi:hypothetical protein